jgi:CheY-like chemotaxis protein
MLRPLLGEDILLVIQHANLHGRVRIDRGQLEQIILNLVLNARDAMPSGGTLTLTTREALVDATFASTHADLRPGPYMALCVQDTGEGMSAEVQARAFDPFFTTKAQAKGTGLGLSTVYGIARQSGCAIWLESQPGSGTRVWIYLPRVEAELDAEPFGLPSLSVPAGLEVTVLVAEDDPVVREVVLESMRRAGYAVLESVDGQDALHISQRHAGSIDLLVTDVVMPHLGGRELAKTLLTARPGLKVLFMSGYAEEALDLPDGPGGAVDFISKPFTSRELVDRTRRLLQARLSLDLGAPASEAPPPRV